MLNGLYETFSGRSWLPSEAWNFTPAERSAAYGCSNFFTKSPGRWLPYMLSPSMMTRSKGKVPCAFVICCAISYCGRSPVPLSPMAANLTESGLLGRGAVCAKIVAAASGARRRARDRGSRRHERAIVDVPGSSAGVIATEETEGTERIRHRDTETQQRNRVMRSR